MNLRIDTLSFSAGTSPAAMVPVGAAPSPPVSPPPSAPPVQALPSENAVKNAARQISDFLKSSSASIRFSVDQSRHEVVVRIVDPQTNEVIRQVPSEELLAIAQSLDRMSGLLLKQTA
jgi:flagellar protein FlaG